MSTIGALANEISVAIKGQVIAEVEAVFLGGLGNAYMRIQISDINNVIQRKPGAVALYYEVSVVEIPTFIDILLLDPVAIVDSVEKFVPIIFCLFNGSHLKKFGRNICFY